MARVHVIDSVFKEYPSKWKLCFQWCLYDYENGKSDKGFRFIWKTPEGENYKQQEDKLVFLT